MRQPRLRNRIRFERPDRALSAVDTLRDVQQKMSSLGHSIGKIGLFGLAEGWNAPLDLTNFSRGTRKAFLRCRNCGQPGIVAPDFALSGAALTDRCQKPR